MLKYVLVCLHILCYSIYLQSPFNDVYCGNSRWKAARETTARNKKLEETGLVVAGCRHALAQKAVNMFAGELYGYSHYLHIFFLMKNSVDYLFQDVMCKYWPWAQKVGVTSSLWGKGTTDLKLALSVFHAKAHSRHCQVSSIIVFKELITMYLLL